MTETHWDWGWGLISSRARNELGWHWPGAGSLQTESKEGYSSVARQVTHLFWLVWPGSDWWKSSGVVRKAQLWG